MLFILKVVTLLLVEDMIFILMINLKLIQIIVVSRVHIQEENKMSLMEEIVILQLLNVKLIMLNLNN